MRAHHLFLSRSILAACSLFAGHSALGITWTGPAGGSWFTPGNWDSGTVPLATLDVVIASNRSVAVDALGAVGLQLTLGSTGANSTGTLTVQNGGQGISGNAFVNQGSLLQITGANSQWTVNGRMGVQGNPSVPSSPGPNVTVSGGGSLVVNPGALNSYFDYRATLAVTGTGSTFTHNGSIALFTGTFNFLDHAVVTTGGTVLGTFDDNIAIVNVDNGAQWTLPGLTVDNSGANTATGHTDVNLNNGGSLVVTGTGLAVGRFGRINVGTGGLAGNLSASTLNLYKTGATLAFNHTDNVSLSTTIIGLGNVSKEGTGVTTLSGISPYTGTTTVTGGTLHLTGSASSSETTVGLSGTLSGSGTAGRVVLNGTLSPGALAATGSTGLFTIGANSIFNGIVKLEIGGLARGTQYDAINVATNGGLTFGGDLNIDLVNSFAPVPGDSFDLFNGTLSGTFAHLNLPALSSDFTWDTSQFYTSGVVSVVPEPATAMLMLAGLALPILRRQRK